MLTQTNNDGVLNTLGWMDYHAADYNRFKNGDSIITFSKDHWYK
jgi:hypothetical protein